jgi:hypothetical protein
MRRDLLVRDFSGRRSSEPSAPGGEPCRCAPADDGNYQHAVSTQVCDCHARDACFQRPHPKADFLARVEDSFKPDPLAQPSQAVIAVFELLSKKISRGEIDDVRHALPEEVRTLWPEPYVSAGMMRA